jgi:hypothetical protein
MKRVNKIYLIITRHPSIRAAGTWNYRLYQSDLEIMAVSFREFALCRLPLALGKRAISIPHLC